MIDQPLWETWTNRLPTRPLCCDVFADGVFRRPRAEALARQHLQFNTDTSLGWLVFDVDHEHSFEAWDRANLHPPNLYAQNPANGNSHLLYALATPVGICDSHRRAPIELAAAVQRGMTRRFRSDPSAVRRAQSCGRFRAAMESYNESVICVAYEFVSNPPVSGQTRWCSSR